MANLPTRNNNPGNLRDPSTGQFRVFATPEEGFAALLNDLQMKIDGRSRTGLNGSSTLVDFASKYAPKGDGANNPGSYAAAIANSLGVAPNTTLKDIQPRLGEFAEAVAKHEGWKGPIGTAKASGVYNLPQATTEQGGSEPSPFTDIKPNEPQKPFKQQVSSAATGLIQSQPSVFGLGTGLATAMRTIGGGRGFVGSTPGGVDSTDFEGTQQYNAAQDDQKIINQLHKLRAAGVKKDDPKIGRLIGLLKERMGQTSPTQAEIDPGTKLTNDQVMNSAMLTGAAALGGPSLIKQGVGLLPKLAGIGGTGGLLSKGIKLGTKAAAAYGTYQAIKHSPVKGVLNAIGPFFE